MFLDTSKMGSESAPKRADILPINETQGTVIPQAEIAEVVENRAKEVQTENSITTESVQIAEPIQAIEQNVEPEIVEKDITNTAAEDLVVRQKRLLSLITEGVKLAKKSGGQTITQEMDLILDESSQPQ